MSRPQDAASGKFTASNAFPFSDRLCGNCGAPTVRHEMSDPPKPGMWLQRYDDTSVARQAALLDEARALLEMPRTAVAHFYTRRDKWLAKLRASGPQHERTGESP